MTEGFRLAHFTDAHLPLHGTLAFRELLGKRALSALNWTLRRRRLHLMDVAEALKTDILAAAPDHVAMTGDAVNFGLPREYEEAAAWLDGFGEPEALSFVPGNHEALHPGAEAALARAFARFSAAGPDEWPWTRRRGPVALIGVSSAIPTPPGSAQGEVGPDQIDRLRTALDATKDAFRIVMIHHPPTDMAKPRKALRDRRAVVKAIGAAGAELVLHGHDHRNELSWIDDDSGRRIPVLGAPSASCPGLGHEPSEWRLLTVKAKDDDWRIGVVRRAWSGAAFGERGRFALTIPRAA